MKLQIINKKVARKIQKEPEASAYIWKSIVSFCSAYQLKIVTIKNEETFRLSDNKSVACQNMWNAAKLVLRENL